MTSRSKENLLPTEYGDACMEQMSKIIDREFPQQLILSRFKNDKFFSSLEALANSIGQRFPVIPFSTAGDLLTQLEHSSESNRRNCRMNTVLLGCILNRDKLADELLLTNVAFSTESNKHSQLIAIRNGFKFIVHFTGIAEAKVDDYGFGRFPYQTYRFNEIGLFNFEKAVKNI